MGKSRPKPPCKNCKDRHAGCHSECDRWKAYKTADKAWKADHQPPPEDVVNYFVKRDENINKLRKRREGK